MYLQTLNFEVNILLSMLKIYIVQVSRSIFTKFHT